MFKIAKFICHQAYLLFKIYANILHHSLLFCIVQMYYKWHEESPGLSIVQTESIIACLF